MSLLAIIVAAWWLGRLQQTSVDEALPADISTTSSAVTATTKTNQKLSTDNLPNGIHIGKTNQVPEMLMIPAGSFVMGCNTGWDDIIGGCRDNEYPAHPVDVAAFELSRHEITVGQFKHFIDATGYKTTAEKFSQGCVIKNTKKSGWKLSKKHNWKNVGFPQTDVHPVVCISWIDTQHYIQWLNKLTGNHYRLATEEEWEYAARANQVTAFYWGNKANRNFANYSGVGDGDSWQYTSPVGQFSSNAFGLHDMSGNAWEWVNDCWRKDYQTPRVTNCNGKNASKTRRGGSWDNIPPSIRSAFRSEGKAIDRSQVYGFRIAHDIIRTLHEKPNE